MNKGEKIMNLTYFRPKMRGNVNNKNNSPENIRFVAKTSDTSNLSETIRSDVATSELAALPTTAPGWLFLIYRPQPFPYSTVKAGFASHYDATIK